MKTKWMVSLVALALFVSPSFGAQSQPALCLSDSAFSRSDVNMGLLADAAAGEDTDDEELDFLDEEWEDGEFVSVADPLSWWNRGMFHFNDKLYFWVLKPVARGYKFVVPTPVRSGIRNFFDNLFFPKRFVNNLLQGKIHGAGSEFVRFSVNTTAGCLGFWNLMDDYTELKASDEDFGQTLGSYGIGNGIYLVWPVFGPSTARDTVGMVGDFFLNPVRYVSPWEARVGLTALRMVNLTSFRIGDYEALKDAALEPYEAFRDAYLQHRQKLVDE